MSNVAIRVENLGKKYRIGGPQERYKTLRDSMMGAASAPFRQLRSTFQRSNVQRSNADTTLWALKDLSFEVKRGEVIGVIGRNGAGKSTLLKILSRITEPTEGCAEIHGRVGSLLEVGTGFHPELTGRENVYLNGSILGMRKAEINSKFDEIVAFSGVEKFIDTPVKRYSSGMYVRLAFAVAAHLEPEILLVDEVLSVGDAAFQDKCLGKISEVASGGRTVLFVSHNMSAVASLCSTACWIDSGKVRGLGITGAVVDEYLKTTRMRDGSLSLKDRRDRTGSGAVRAMELTIEDLRGRKLPYVEAGQGIRLVISYSAALSEKIREATVHLFVANSRDQRLFCCMSDVAGGELKNLPETGRLVCSLPELPLVPGHYELHLSLHANRELADKIQSAASFQVVEGDFFGTGHLPPDFVGNVMIRHSWQVEKG